MPNKKKVLILSSYGADPKDNCYRIRYLTALGLSNTGDFDVTIIAPSVKSLEYSIKNSDNGTRIISTLGLFPYRYRKGGFSFLDMLQKCAVIAQGHFDYIHTDLGHRPASVIPALLGARLHGTKIVNEWWEWFGGGGIANERSNGFIQRLLAAYDNSYEISGTCRYDGVLPITSILGRRLREACPDVRAAVLHGGAESERLVSFSILEARKRTGLEEHLFIVGMVNLVVDDEIDNRLFLDAFDDLCLRHKDLRLFVTGDKRYITEKFLPSVRYPDRVIYPGWVERNQYNDYLSSCDIFLLPLRNNLRNRGRWPNKICDYMVINRPIITNPIGDLKEIFESYRIGIVCDESPAAFSQALEQCIGNMDGNDALCADQAKYVASELTFSARITKIAHFYRSLDDSGSD